MTAAEKRREYMRKYKKTHREELNAYARKWRKANPEKQKEYTARYWEKKAREEVAP